MSVEETNQLREVLEQQLSESMNSSTPPLATCTLTGTGHVVYSTQIAERFGRKPSHTDASEEYVRALTVLYLVEELNYPPNLLALEYKVRARVGRSGQGSGDKYTDIAILSEDGNVWCMIELKAPSQYDSELYEAWEGQLFGIASFIKPRPKQLAYGKVEIDSGKPVLSIVNATEFDSYEDWKQAGMPTKDLLTDNYGKPKQEKFIRGGVGGRKLTASLGKNELAQLQTSLHNVLWGGGSTSDTDIFNLLTRLILAKTQDEKITSFGEEYSFQIRENESFEDTLKRIDMLYQEGMSSRLHMETNNPVRDPNKGTDAQIRFAIEKLARYDLLEIARTEQGQDIIGDFFERIMRTGFKQSKGQFFTHRNIVDFMVEVVGLHDWSANNARDGDPPPHD